MARPLYEEPFVLATAGTLAVHLIIAVAGDAIVVTHPYVPEKDPPHVELVDIQLPVPPPPPAPPEPPPPAAKEPEAPPVPAKIVHEAPRATTRPAAVASETPPPKSDTPPPTGDPGGGPVVAMDSLGPDAMGQVPVAPGKMPQGHIGRGGTGTGTGAGNGGGSAEAAPMSVATIKTRALPKGDYGYIDASRDYPTEAKQLGIEGPVRVRLVVDDRGAVTRATLLPPGLGHGLDELALRKAKEIRFEPARDTEDHPVTSVVVWTFNMTLPK